MLFHLADVTEVERKGEGVSMCCKLSSNKFQEVLVFLICNACSNFSNLLMFYAKLVLKKKFETRLE